MTNKYVNTQMNDLNKEITQELIRLLLVSLDGKDFSTEATLAGLATAFNNEDFSSEATLSALRADFNAEDFVTETTFSAFRTDFNNEDFAQEATLSAFKTAFDNRDLATETTLAALLSAFNLEDFASESTLTALSAKLNTLGQKASADSAPVVLSTAQEAILEAMKTALQNLDADIDSLATEATLSSLLTAFNNEDFATETTLTALESKDFATQTTLAALLAAFGNEDFASETTLDALLTALNSKDFASEATLATINNKLNTLGQKDKAGSTPVVLASDQDNLNVNIYDEAGNAFSNQNPLPTSSMSELIREEYDSIELTYVSGGPANGEIETATYKNGATTVGVVTLSYDGLGNLATIVRT